MFLSEIEELLDGMTSQQFKQIQFSLAQQIASCVASPQFQVAERTLYFWNNINFMRHIDEHLESVFPVLFPVLFRYSKSHWNKIINGLASNAMKLMIDKDREKFMVCLNTYMQNSDMTAESNEKLWDLLDQMKLNTKKETTDNRRDSILYSKPDLTASGLQNYKQDLQFRRRSKLPRDDEILKDLEKYANPIDALSSDNIRDTPQDEPNKSKAKLTRRNNTSGIKSDGKITR